MKHHQLQQYKNTYLYKLYEKKWSKFVAYTKFRSTVATCIFLAGTLFLTLGALFLMNILAPSYIFILIFLLPCIPSSYFTRNELFFLLDANIQEQDNRVYSNNLPRWVYWLLTVFTNLMVVGSLSLCLFVSTCYLLADKEPMRESIYIEQLESNNKTEVRDAHILFSDGKKDLIYNVDNT